MPSANLDNMDWVQQVAKATENDSRVQPWKHIYQGLLSNTLQPGPDYMTVTSHGGNNVGSGHARDRSIVA